MISRSRNPRASQQLAVVTAELDAAKYRITEAEHQRDILTVRLKAAGNEAASAVGRMEDDIKRLKAQLVRRETERSRAFRCE